MLLACVPETALAGGLVLRDTGLRATTVRSDGEQRLALAAGDGPVSVLDTRTQTFSAIATPAGCRFVDIHRATLLWNCPSSRSFPSGMTYEMATGRVASLRPLQSGSEFGGAEQANYATIGDRFARISLGGYHYGSDAAVYVDRTTGRQFHRAARFGQVRDLDAPALTRELCAGSLKPQIQGGIDLQPGDPVVAGPWTAALTLTDSYQEHIELQRCGGRGRTIRVCRTVTCSQPVLDHRIVAWTEARGVGVTFSSRLVVRRLRSGRVRRTPWQTTRLSPLLADRRLYAHEGPSLPGLGTMPGRVLRAAL